MKVTGDSELELKLGLTIGKEVDAKVSGILQLQNNTLELVQVSGLLSEINGKLRFNETDISAKNVQAKLFGQPVVIRALTRDSRYNKNIRINQYTAVVFGKVGSHDSLLRPLVDG